MSQFFTSGGQSFGVSASASVLPMDTQDWSHQYSVFFVRFFKGKVDILDIYFEE